MTQLQKNMLISLTDESFEQAELNFHDLPSSIQETENQLNALFSLVGYSPEALKSINGKIVK